jgi:hypothetical protein
LGTISAFLFFAVRILLIGTDYLTRIVAVAGGDLRT